MDCGGDGILFVRIKKYGGPRRRTTASTAPCCFMGGGGKLAADFGPFATLEPSGSYVRERGRERARGHRMETRFSTP